MVHPARLAALALLLMAALASQARAAVYTSFVTAAQNAYNTPTRVKLSRDDTSFPSGQGKTWGNGVIDGTGNAGGEFRVTWDHDGDGSSGTAFQTLSYLNAEGDSWIYKTFCIERGETFSPGNSYFVTVDPVAYNGAYGGGTPDPLGAEAKLLYGLYFLGTLDNQVGLSFTYNDNDWANALQAAFWNLEDIKPTTGDLEAGVPASVLGKADDLVDWAKGKVLSGADDFAGDVQVLNLWDSKSFNPATGKWEYSGLRQSQLVHIPDPPGGSTQPVPEPTSAIAWLLGMGVCGAVSLKRTRRLARDNRRKVLSANDLRP